MIRKDAAYDTSFLPVPSFFSLLSFVILMNERNKINRSEGNIIHLKSQFMN